MHLYMSYIYIHAYDCILMAICISSGYSIDSVPIYIYIYTYIYSAWPIRAHGRASRLAHKGPEGRIRARPMMAQGSPQGPGPKGPRGPTRARPTRAWPKRAHQADKSMAKKGLAHKGPQRPGPQVPSGPTRAWPTRARPTRAWPTRAEVGPKGPTGAHKCPGPGP